MKKIINLIFQGLHLKQIKHEWWRFAWIHNPDSVAEHSLNAAQIWYILAKISNADANKVAAMLVWHDLAEARIWDLHKVASRYFENKKEAEDNAFRDTISWIDFWEDIYDLYNDYDNKLTLEWQIAKDADYLEQAFQWKYYKEIWYEHAQDWIDNVWISLKTQAAKDIWNEMTKSSFVDWWKETNLKKL